jgi:hypothetical protein
MTAVKRCPRCGLDKAAEAFYRRRGRRLSSYSQLSTRAASREANDQRRQDPTAAVQRRVVDRIRQRRHRALGRHGVDGR